MIIKMAIVIGMTGLSIMLIVICLSNTNKLLKGQPLKFPRKYQGPAEISGLQAIFFHFLMLLLAAYITYIAWFMAKDTFWSK